MDKPIFIKCNIMLPSRELEYERLQIKKQIEEDGLVVLPPGFELADVDVSLLEQIKAEIEKERDFWDKNANDYTFGHYKAFGICVDILDKHISKQKGE